MDYLFGGIDPGLDGAICRIGPCDHVEARVVPTIQLTKGRAKRAYDIALIVAILTEIQLSNVGLIALEKGRAAPGQGVSSMFRFGYGCGLWEGMLAALRLPYIIVHPNAWQKAICAGLSGDPKARAVQAASSMLPDLDLRRSQRARKPHQGIADAACLALFAKRTFLGKTE